MNSNWKFVIKRLGGKGILSKESKIFIVKFEFEKESVGENGNFLGGIVGEVKRIILWKVL